MPEAPDRSSVSAPDPLTALRSSDARPLVEQWRDRSRAWWADRRLDPRVLAVLVVVVVSAVVAPRLLRAGDPPIEDSIPLAVPVASSAAPIPAEQVDLATGQAQAEESTVVVVHVAGAVQAPGLVAGSPGWRVADAIAAAGGTSPGADLDRVNLAAPIVDGERLFVPRTDEEPPTVVTGTRPSGASGTSAVDREPVNLNAASPGDLERLPGVGPVTAEAIVAHRDAHGPFGSVDALVAVRGIGPATVEALREHAVVG